MGFGIKNNYCIYIHTNKINGKIYVGMTCQKPLKRWGQRGQNYKECPYFWSAIQKYGWQNFEHIIIKDNLTREQALELEVNTIAERNSRNAKYGYNISVGGDCPDPDIAKSIWEDKNKRKYAMEKMKEAWKDPAKRKRRSNAAKERWANPEFKEFAKKRVTEACARPILCVETGETFDTIKSAAEKYNICSANISRSAKIGYRCGNYHWQYVDVAS